MWLEPMPRIIVHKYIIYKRPHQLRNQIQIQGTSVYNCNIEQKCDMIKDQYYWV